MKTSDRIDRLLDVMNMLLISGFISWVIGRFEVFPVYESLDFYCFKCSTDVVSVMCVLFYFIMTIYHSKNITLFSIFIVSLSPYVLFVFLKIFIKYIVLRYIVLICIMILIVLYFILAVFYKKKISMRRLVNRILTLIIIMMYVISLMNILVPQLAFDDIEGNISQSYDLLEYDYILTRFQDENWCGMDIKEKELAINELIQIEMVYLLGEIDQELKVVLKDIDNQSLYGYYSNSTITLNTSLLNDRVTTIFVALHECYHHYQYELINILEDKMNSNFITIREVKQWKEEYENYITANEDYTEYYNQELEKSAREYSQSRINAYLNIIGE